MTRPWKHSDISREPPDSGVLSIELRCSLALMLNFYGEHQKSLTRLGEAETLARQLDNRALLGRVLSVMSYTRRELGDLDGAIAAGRQGHEIATALSDPIQQATAAYRLAQAYHASGDFGLAAELLRGNVEALSLDAPDRSRKSRAFHERGWRVSRVRSAGLPRAAAMGKRGSAWPWRKDEGRRRSLPAGAWASCTSPKGIWKRPSGSSKPAGLSVAQLTIETGQKSSRGHWVKPMDTLDASKRASRSWRRRSEPRSEEVR